MNIFYLSHDPADAARWQTDKHVVKMILESAQLLCGAHHVCGTINDATQLYKLTHKNHPCSLWVRESSANYTWLLTHFVTLCDEFTQRYGGKIHKSSLLLPQLSILPLNISRGTEITTPPSCMPPEYIISHDPVINYRNYYTVGKSHIHAWKQNKPHWIL